MVNCAPDIIHYIGLHCIILHAMTLQSIALHGIYRSWHQIRCITYVLLHCSALLYITSHLITSTCIAACCTVLLYITVEHVTFHMRMCLHIYRHTTVLVVCMFLPLSLSLSLSLSKQVYKYIITVS